MINSEVNESVDGGCNFSVKLRKNETSDSLIKRFFRKQKKERLIEELVENKRFKKNATLKREALYRKSIIMKKLRQKELLQLQD